MIITNEELLLYILKYPQLKQLDNDDILDLIKSYKEWLLDDLDWLEEQGGNPDSMDLLEVYFECLKEDEDFMKEQMQEWNQK
jgi:hypothetical protein